MRETAGIQPDLSLIAVNRNTRELLPALFDSIRETSDGLSLEVIMVDNASTDGSAEFVRDCYPDVRVLENRRNMGFAAANNWGIRESRGRHLLLINTDVVVLPGALQTMLCFMEGHSEAGVVGCKVLNPDGSLQLSGKTFPDPAAAFYIGLGLHRVFPNNRIAKRYYLPEQSYESLQEVDHVSGSCMMVNRSAIDRVGLLDEKFFLYCEDVDWCARIQAGGFKIYYVPEARIVHHKGASSSKESRRMIQEYHRSAWYFYRKHHAPHSSPLLTGLMFLGINARRSWLMLVDTFSRKKKVRY